MGSELPDGTLQARLETQTHGLVTGTKPNGGWFRAVPYSGRRASTGLMRVARLAGR